MDKRKQANQRVKGRITAALLHLLEHKSISEISVSKSSQRQAWRAHPFTGTTPQRRASSPR